ncbi:MAG: zinc-ribbon domain-containing protein [Spirochaetaceae bacterium]|jgi:hypothetical protein|nr:zinc-ribbon domain-containing protein [Spirochaetaceae bacterium]
MEQKYFAKGIITMDTVFIATVQKLVTEQGKEALFNTAKCKSFLADYTKGEYKKESRLLLQAIEAGVAKAIDSTRELQICKQQQTRCLHEEYFLTEEIAAELVDMLTLVLRPDNGHEKGEDLFCSECGAPLSEGAKFCSSCGKPTATEQSASQSTPKPEQKVAALTSSGGIGYGIDLITFIPKTSVPSQEDIFNTAIQRITETITQDPGNASAYIERGEYYLCLSNFGNARSDFKNAKKLLQKHSNEYAHVNDLLKSTSTSKDRLQWCISMVGLFASGPIIFGLSVPVGVLVFLISLTSIALVGEIDWQHAGELIQKIREEKTKS